MPRKTIIVELKVELDVVYSISEAEPSVGFSCAGVDHFEIMGQPKLLDPWKDVVMEELNNLLPDYFER